MTIPLALIGDIGSALTDAESHADAAEYTTARTLLDEQIEPAMEQLRDAYRQTAGAQRNTLAAMATPLAQRVTSLRDRLPVSHAVSQGAAEDDPEQDVDPDAESA